MEKIKQLYETSKSAKVGSICKCPSCGKEFVKTNYQQAFCKSKKGTVCKDKYWNTVTPEKKNNTTRISPASKAYSCMQYEIRNAQPKRDNSMMRTNANEKKRFFITCAPIYTGSIKMQGWV